MDCPWYLGFQATEECIKNCTIMEENRDDSICPESASEMEETFVCNMPEIATIELHQSNETGKYYLHFIGWTGKKQTDGVWHDREATEKEVKLITDMVEMNNAKELLDN